jgi:hypothetical protein
MKICREGTWAMWVATAALGMGLGCDGGRDVAPLMGGSATRRKHPG